MTRTYRLQQAMRRELRIFKHNPAIQRVWSGDNYQAELHKLRQSDPLLYRNYLDACDRAMRAANSEE